MQEGSLDLAAVQVDPEAPSIWFSTASSRAAAEGLSSLASGATGQSAAAAVEAEGAEGTGEGGTHATAEEGAAEGQEPAVVSPFAAAAGSADGIATEPSTADSSTEAGGQAATAGPPGPLEPIPPADEATAAAIAKAAAAAAAAVAADTGSPQVRACKAALATAATSVGGTSAAGSSAASSRLQLDKQLTLRYPTVITPSGGCH